MSKRNVDGERGLLCWSVANRQVCLRLLCAWKLSRPFCVASGGLADRRWQAGMSADGFAPPFGRVSLVFGLLRTGTGTVAIQTAIGCPESRIYRRGEVMRHFHAAAFSLGSSTSSSTVGLRGWLVGTSNNTVGETKKTRDGCIVIPLNLRLRKAAAAICQTCTGKASLPSELRTKAPSSFKNCNMMLKIFTFACAIATGCK